MKNVSAIILAGGKSTRMGQDKAFVEWKGKPFLHHLIDAVAPITTDVFISGEAKELNNYGITVVKDEIPNSGPVVALASCFKKTMKENVIVLSCDAPQVTTQNIIELLDKHDNAFDVTYYTSMSRSLPLVGIYNKRSFEPFRVALKKGERKLFNVINKLKVQEIEYKNEGGLLNINTPQDIELLP